MTPESDPGTLRYHTNDPLGVIENAAKQIWKNRGAPAGTTWRDYFAEAEQLLIAGRGTLPDSAEPEELPISKLELLPPEIWALRDQDTDPLRAAVAWGVNELFDEHEAFCFARLLGSNEFKVMGGEFQACPEDEIIVLLASLAGEYDEDFVKSEGQGDLSTVSKEKRREYWRKKMLQWRSDDRPLNYHDRNTIERLKDAITKHSALEGCRLLRGANERIMEENRSEHGK